MNAQQIDDNAVDLFAAAMKEKLAQARDKGRGGWQACEPVLLSQMLREHVEKGDPRDVANFCMFLWALGQPIAASAQQDEREALSVEEIEAAFDAELKDDGDVTVDQVKNWLLAHDYFKAGMLAGFARAAQQVQADAGAVLRYALLTKHGLTSMHPRTDGPWVRYDDIAKESDKGERAYAIYRKREDENDGNEFFHYAAWHDDVIPGEGERKVAGWFIPDSAMSREQSGGGAK